MSPASYAPVRILFGILKLSKSFLLTFLLIAALALNVATLTVGSVFAALSSLVGAVAELVTTKPITIQSKQKVRVDDLKKKNLDLTNKNIDLKNRLNAKTHVRFKGQRRLVNEAVQDTTEAVSTRLVKATARSTSSVFAESIPYIGIGAIVAVTALELKDACATLDDLHDLDVAFNPDAAHEPGHKEFCGQEVPTKGAIKRSVMESPSRAWNAAKESLPDLPSWRETLRAAKRKAREILKWMIDLLGF